jgi:sporulation protein YlmC with PRC-barrel domain
MVMRKELRIATALAALLANPALAQNPTPTTPTTGQQTAPGPTLPVGGTALPACPDTQPPAAASKAGGPRFIDTQQDEEMLADTLIGTRVYNAENQSLGEINDVLLARDGRLRAVVVGVGGFLGLAERDMTVPWGALGVSGDEDRDLQLRLEPRAARARIGVHDRG